MPVSRRLYLAACLYRPRYSDDCQEQDILYDARSPFSLLKQPQRRQEAVRRLMRLQGIPHLLSGIKSARNRCLQFRSVLRFRAILGYSFLYLSCLTARVQSRSRNTDYNDAIVEEGQRRRIARDREEFVRWTNSSSIAVGWFVGTGKIASSTKFSNSRRLHFDVYFRTFLSLLEKLRANETV